MINRSQLFSCCCFTLCCLSCFPLQEELQDGNFSLRKDLCYEFSVLKVSSHTRGNTGTQQFTKKKKKIKGYASLSYYEEFQETHRGSTCTIRVVEWRTTAQTHSKLSARKSPTKILLFLFLDTQYYLLELLL